MIDLLLVLTLSHFNIPAVSVISPGNLLRIWGLSSSLCSGWISWASFGWFHNDPLLTFHMTYSHCAKDHAAWHQGLLFHLAIIILLIQDPSVYGSFLVKSHCFDGLMMCSAAFGVLGNFLKLTLIFVKIEYLPVYAILMFDIKLEQMVLGGSFT